MNTSRFRFSTRSLLLLVLHSSVFFTVIASALRFKAIEVVPLLWKFQKWLFELPLVFTAPIMTCAAFAPITVPLLVIVILVRQSYSSKPLVSGWYFIGLTLAISLIEFPSLRSVADGWEYGTRMAMVLLATAIIAFVEARWRIPTDTTRPPVEPVYGGDVPVPMTPPRRIPERYITPLLIALCAIQLACFVVAFEAMLSI